jgi:tetratricopeptide (TPR) repeat protein
MHKGPIAAIIISIIAIVGIYFFTDIKENKDVTTLETVDAPIDNDQISAFKATLDEDDRVKVQSLYDDAIKNKNPQAVEDLIAFYEDKEQFNFAAFYHTLMAETSPSSKNWELAGDRQLSVSANEGYNEAFNTTLYEEALASYQEAINLDTGNLELQVKLGSAIVDRSPQPMQGITLLLGVIEKDSMHLNGNLALGKFGIISGQYDKAVIRLEKVLSLQPENTEALFLAGEAYSSLGNTDKAVACLSKCKELVENEELKKEIDAYLQQLL